MKTLVGLLLVTLLCGVSSLSSFVNFSWKLLTFDYTGSPVSLTADRTSNFYVPNIPAPIDMDYDGNKDRTFVTIPRFQSGSPATLGWFSNNVQNFDNKAIIPYPSWEWHRDPRSCKAKRMISVYRIKIDRCNRLWVLDTGKYGNDQTCPPQILAFDLKTDQLIKSFTIPSNLLEGRSILVTPAVDVRETCDDTFVYVSDCQAYSIIVYDVKNGAAWKASHRSMFPDSRCGTYRISGEQFDLMDGVFGLALDPYVKGKDLRLFYHSMSGTAQNWIYTSYLRDKNRWQNDPESSPQLFNTYPDFRESQAAAIDIDDKGVAYFGQMSPNGMYCWNTGGQFYGGGLEEIYYNNVTMQFPSGVKVVTRNNLQYVLAMTSRFQKVVLGTLNANEVNFRINSLAIADIRSQGFCRVPQNSWMGSTCGECYY